MSKELSRISLFWGTLGGGGIERVMIALAEEFLEREIETEIILLEKKGELSGELPSEARVFDLGADRLTKSLPALAQHLRRQRPPLLLSAGTYTNRVALLSRMLAGVPSSIVISEHIALSPRASLTSASGSILPEWALDQLTKWTYSQADKMIAVSKGVADDVSQSLNLRREDFEVVYNPVVGPETFKRAKENVEHQWFSEDSIPVILGVGRLVEQKGFSTLIKAFSEVRGWRRSHLVILGEGNKRKVLEEQAKRLGVSDHVWMPGFVSNPLKYMADASVFVLSSRWEGLGNALIEAMACGTPVVSTNCESGPSEILKGGKYGRLVPVGDSIALAAAVEEALDGHVPPAPRSALDRFRQDTVAEQYLDILGSVA